MKDLKSLFSIVAVLTFSAGIANAQMMLQKATISAGGGMVSNTSIKGGVTAGQTVTGTSSNSTMKAELGFWTSEASASGVAQSANMKVGIEVWPNPVAALATASITLVNASNLDVSLYDVNGRMVRSIFSGYTSSGSRSLAIDLSGLASSSYILAARIPGQIIESRVTLIGLQ